MIPVALTQYKTRFQSPWKAYPIAAQMSRTIPTVTKKLPQLIVCQFKTFYPRACKDELH